AHGGQPQPRSPPYGSPPKGKRCCQKRGEPEANPVPRGSPHKPSTERSGIMSKHLMRAAGLAVVLALLLGIFPVLGSNQAQAASNVTVTRRTLLAGTAHATEAVIIRAPASGPTVLVVGGIHGDQPAGVQAAQRVAQYRDITRGTLIVVPAINKLAVQRGQRTAADGVDLNRTFPTRSGASPTDARSRALWNLIRSEGVEYVLDLHEGKNYQSISSSIGQMVIHYNNRGTKEMADAMV